MNQRKSIGLEAVVLKFFLGLLLTFFIVGDCFGKGITISNFKPPNKEEVVWMESFTVQTMRVAFLYKSKPGYLQGMLDNFPSATTVDHIHYVIKSPSGALLWEKTVEDFKIEASGEAQFSLELGGLEMPEKSVLEASVYNKKGTLLAQGEGFVAAQRFALQPGIEDLSVEIMKDRGVARFALHNKTAHEVTLTPHLEIFNRAEDQLLGAYQVEPLSASGGEREVVEIGFDLPADPQVYVVRVFFRDAADTIVGGSLTKQFLIKGNFAQVKTFDLLEEDLKAKTINFIFSGASLPNQSLTVELQSTQEWEGSVVDTLSAKQSLQSDRRGRFTGSFGITLESNADFFRANLVVSHGGKVIGEKTLEKALVVAPGLTDALEAQKEAQELAATVEEIKWWMRKDWLVWGGVLIFLLLLATNNWLRLHKKHLRMFLVFCFFAGHASAQAPTPHNPDPQVWWSYPTVTAHSAVEDTQEPWYFNPNAQAMSAPLNTAGFEHFSKIRFRGQILSGLNELTDPLFANPVENTKPNPGVLVEFDNGVNQGWVALLSGVPAPDFSPPAQEDYLAIKDSVQFEFEIDTSDPSYTMQGTDPIVTLKDFLEDGTWDFRVYFCMEDLTPDWDCDGGKWYASTKKQINIDTTPPAFTKQHDEDSAQVLHSSELGSHHDDLESKITARETKRKARIIAEKEKQEKLQTIQDLEAQMAEKVWRIEKIDENIIILNYRIGLLDAIIDDLYAPPEEQSAAAVQKTAINDQIDAANAEKATLNGDISVIDTQITTLEAEVNDTDGTITQTISGLEADIAELEDPADSEEMGIPDLREAIEVIRRRSKPADVRLDVTCTDDGAECNQASYMVLVNGDFCDDASICDTSGAREIVLCDKVGNCLDAAGRVKNDIDWYDAEPPETNFQLKNYPNGLENASNDLSSSSSEIRAGEILSFSLPGTVDLRQKDGESTFGPTLAYDYNSDACGANANAPFYADSGSGESLCYERVTACANSSIQRGTLELDAGGAACASLCPDGYIFDNDICYIDCDQRNLEICLPGILGRGECSETDFNAWSPDPSTQDNGIPFMQENNCGNLRQAVGSGAACANINTIGCAPFNGAATFQP